MVSHIIVQVDVEIKFYVFFQLDQILLLVFESFEMHDKHCWVIHNHRMKPTLLVLAVLAPILHGLLGGEYIETVLQSVYIIFLQLLHQLETIVFLIGTIIGIEVQQVLPIDSKHTSPQLKRPG